MSGPYSGSSREGREDLMQRPLGLFFSSEVLIPHCHALPTSSADCCIRIFFNDSAVAPSVALGHKGGDRGDRA